MSELRVECGHRPQDWCYVSSARVALLVERPEGDPLAGRCAEAARTGDLDDVLDALLRDGWRTLPDFTAVDRQTLRVLARGTASAEAQGPGPSGRISNTGRQPWNDVEVDRSVQVVVLHGDTDLSPAPAPAEQVAASAPAVAPAGLAPDRLARHEALTETWEAVGEEAVVAQTPEGGSADRPMPAPSSPAPAARSATPPPAPGPASSPAPTPPPPVPAPSSVGSSPHEASLAAPAAEPPAPSEPGVNADPGGVPAGRRDEPESPERGAEASGPPAPAPVVMAIRCPEGHPNAPHARRCRLCGKDVPPQTPVPMPRPALGELVASTGDRVTLDRDVVVGRSPRVPEDTTDEARPHLLQVPSPGNDVSRNHVRVHLDGWQVKVSDLGSTNGTVVTWPDSEPIQLRPESPRVLEPGTKVSLAADVSFTYQPQP